MRPRLRQVPEALEKLKRVVDASQADYARLRYLVRRLQKEDPKRRVNFKLIADTLRINPSTLYRRYGKENIRSAIKAGHKPLKERQDELKQQSGMAEPTEQDKDAKEIAEMFNDFVVAPDTPSPFLKKRDLSD